MEVETVLEELGLTKSEIKLFLAILKVKEGTAGDLSEYAGMNRRLSYDSLKGLCEKGLISYIDREGKRIYEAITPKSLLDILNDKKRKLANLEENMMELIPDLIKRYEYMPHERSVKLLIGKEGIKRLFNDQINTGKTIYLIGSPGESEKILKYFLPDYTRRRVEKKIKIKGIYERSMEETLKKYDLLEARFLPEKYRSPVNISIYGNKIGIIFWLDKPLVIMIEDDEASKSFKGYFNIAWKKAIKK